MEDGKLDYEIKQSFQSTIAKILDSSTLDINYN